MFIILKIDYFYLWFLYKIDLSIFIAQNHIRIIRIWSENDNILHIIDQIKITRAMLWIKHTLFENSKLQI